MASPQKENGYTAIANELLEAFIIYRFTEYQRLVILHIWRMTYGFRKHEDWIANSQFVKATNIRKGHISRTLKELKELNVVTCRGNKIRVNKDWESWKVTSRGNNSYLYRSQKLPPQELQKKKEIINIHASVKKPSVPSKMYNQEPDNIDTTLNEDGEVLRGPEKKSGIGKATKELVKWAEKKRGRRFTNILKQYTAIKKMRLAGLRVPQICDRWEEMENEQFWQDKGFDFTSVANSFDKR